VGGDHERPSHITGAGVVHLAKIPNLEELELQNSQVTVQGLEPLHELANLKSLVLNGSQADDLDAVSALFPKCSIDASEK
jgi:hypothetical protein